DYIKPNGGRKWIPIMETQLASAVAGPRRADLLAQIKEDVELANKASKERRFEGLSAPFRDVFDLLDERCITTILDKYKILEQLDLPEPEFPNFRECETLKLLPPPDSSGPDMERFWNSLRSIRQPLSFTLMTPEDRVCFVLTFPKGHRAFI